MPGTRATPPVKMTGSSTRPPTMAVVRRAMEAWTPAAMASDELPEANRPTISVSAKTAQVLLMGAAPVAPATNRPRLGKSTPSLAATSSRKRPVPAAQRSFITKSRTRPAWLSQMTLLSWPPMSTMVSASGRTWRTPRAWQVISVIVVAFSPVELRP